MRLLLVLIVLAPMVSFALPKGSAQKARVRGFIYAPVDFAKAEKETFKAQGQGSQQLKASLNLESLGNTKDALPLSR